LIIISTVSADKSELAVVRFEMPPLSWGTQTAVFKVVNRTNNVKYLTVETNLRFPQSVLNPLHKTKTNFLLTPLEVRTCSLTVVVPSNYGQAKLTVSFYDVVDTLDVLLPTQRFLTKTFSATFEAPPELRAYLTEQVPQLIASIPARKRRRVLDYELACVL